jgi:hypothetical protein
MQISKEQIENIFENAEDSGDAFIKIYRLVYPNWDKIKQIKGHPKAGRVISEFIARKFVDFEMENQPDQGCLFGGLWLQKGFGVDQKLGDWEVIPAEVVL